MVLLYQSVIHPSLGEKLGALKVLISYLVVVIIKTHSPRITLRMASEHYRPPGASL